ncbi:MAG TPA: acyltransferase [Acidimicrobiia bacterium]|nr:acyltransferase [Acidimicrobiia bacterium]
MSSPAASSAEIGAAGFESGPTLHFPCFDAFRFFAMTMVLLVHATFATQPWVRQHVPDWLRAVLERMDVGVAIFFVISGFLLFRPFVARQLDGKSPVRVRTYLRRRVLRVIPGYWFALTVCVVFLGQLLGSVKNAFLYYFLLFPFASENVALGGKPGATEGNYAIPQAWSLTAEFVFYLMLPLLALWLIRLGARRAQAVRVRNALLVALALYLVGQAYRVYFLTAHPSWERVATIWPPNWIDFFAIGMATATFSAWEHAGGGLPRVLRFLGDHPVVSWLAAVAVGTVCCTFRAPVTPGHYGTEYWFRWFLFGIFAFFLLAPAMFGDQTKGRARKVLATRPLVFLGTVSLGFYLFHLAVMRNVQEWLSPTGTAFFNGSLPTVFGLTFVLSIALAGVSYFAVERPFLRLKDRRLGSIWRREPAKAP